MSDGTASFVIGLFLGAIIATGILFNKSSSQLTDVKNLAIEHGAAQFNSKTGEFEWIKSTK
jgi:hypothetical protein